MRIESYPIFLQRKPPVDPEIKAQLDALGLVSTGNREEDIEAIKKALSGKEMSGQNVAMAQPPQTPPQIAEFMRSIGLEPTNSKEGDNAAVISKLNVLEAQATNEADLNEVKSLRSVWAELTSSASSGESSFQQQSTSSSFAGQDQLARLNRWFLVK